MRDFWWSEVNAMTRGSESALGGVVHVTDGGFGAGDGGVGDGEACGVGATAVGVGVGEGEAAARTRGPLAVQPDSSRIATQSDAMRLMKVPAYAPHPDPLPEGEREQLSPPGLSLRGAPDER